MKTHRKIMWVMIVLISPMAQAQESAGFENVKAGPFATLETLIGTWAPGVGRTIVDDRHAKSGKHCLQLTGGSKTSAVLRIADGVDTSGNLTFWAERWTSRSPFSFRIDKRTGQDWQEIFNGDKAVRVGRAFLSHVTVPLNDASIKQLRFSVTSPPNTGILIDDIRVAPRQPQKILGVEVIPLSLPALIGSKASPLLKLTVEATGTLDPISLTALTATLDGTTNRPDVTWVSVYATGSSSHFRANESVAQIEGRRSRRGPFELSCAGSSCQLAEGVNTFWVTGRIRKGADIDGRVGAVCTQVQFSNGQKVALDAKPSIQRMGVAVRQAGDAGVHTYRIPGLATTNEGTLIGVYDIRHRSGGDLPGDIDVGMSRSTDGGRTWEPMKVIMDMGDDPDFRYDGIGDPAVLVDQNTGTIWVAATWSHGNRSWRGSGPGMTPAETGQLMLVRSDDDGITWSRPINITEQVKDPNWCFILQGPGKGITMRNGTLVFAAQYQDPPEQKRLPHSTIIYSKDHGQTWQAGTGAFDDTTESQVVEIEPGVLMLNCRYNRKPVRVVMTTRDMGKTWQAHTTSERSLIEPGSCMASLIDVGREVGKDAGGWLLFSNPDSIKGRHHITIKASPDRGFSWPKANRLLLDEGNGAGYSCLSMIDEKTVGILYEGSQAHMTFQRIPLKDLVDEPVLPPKASGESLRLPQVFGSHMVLQADAAIPVWGRAKFNAQVTVTLGNDTQRTTANERGAWQVRLNSRTASDAPQTMVIQSRSEQIAFSDVLIGEVWVCAGQSNMEWRLDQSAHGQEELSAVDHPRLRLLHLSGGARGSSGSYTPEHLARLIPDKFCEGQWHVASEASARPFSAVAWYFGRRLQQALDKPIGLICPAVGGTPTEAWIPREALEANPALAALAAGNWLDNERLGEFCRTRGEQNLLQAMQAGDMIPGDQFGPNHSFKPGFMWSAGIEPLIPYAIRGAIWYQGESNAGTPARVREHGRLFPLLIEQWRKAWRQGDFPFLYVQLPAMNRSEWPWFRDGQRRVLEKVQNTGMAVTLDTGLPANVHPPLKKPVGERLATLALGSTYGLTSHATFSSPLFGHAKRKGDAMIVSFKHVGDGLASSRGGPLRHFEIRGDNNVFHPAVARIVGKNSVSVSSPDVVKPTQVRYAWRPFPDPPVNLVNSKGLLASPFSTESEEAVAAQREVEGQRPNILFIVSEDNSEHLGCYGEDRVHTPHLDALATSGVRYTRAYVPYSVCSPSRAAFLTGLYPRQNGQIGLATHRFSMVRDFKTIPAYFQQAGYYTGFLGKTHVNPESLVEDYIDHRAIKGSNFSKTISIETYAEEAHVVMEKAAASNKPFLLIINYADAHRSFVGKSKNGFPTTMVEQEIAPFPWIGSDTPHLRAELRDYFNCMNRLDEGVGMVLDKLDETGNRDNTLIVYISDHGADFPRAKGSIYENGTRIPMIVNYPKTFPRGKVEGSMVSTIDILPTLLRAARLPVPDALPGFALQDIDSGRVSPREYIHTFTTGSSPNLLYMQFGIRDDRYKLVYNPDRAINLLAVSRYQNSRLPKDQEVASFLHPPEYELFDLKKDPYEWKNLADNSAHKNTKARLLKAMQDFQDQIKDPFTSGENIATFIAEQKEYHGKPYRTAGFRWPHLDMFEKAQEVMEVEARDVFKVGQETVRGEGQKAYAQFREQNVVVTKSGRIVVVCQGRNKSDWSDRSGQDLLCKWSDDQGESWSDATLVKTHGQRSICPNAAVYDEQTNIIHVLYNLFLWDYTKVPGNVKGELGDLYCRQYVVTSENEGQTWSPAREITDMVDTKGAVMVVGSGEGIQLKHGPARGRLLVAGGDFYQGKKVLCFYSDDHGHTWQRSNVVPWKGDMSWASESKVAELPDGTVVLNSRTFVVNGSKQRLRTSATSQDGGLTWSTLGNCPDLKTVSCNGALLAVPHAQAKDGTALLCSVPVGPGRTHGTVYISFDHGKTWPHHRIVVPEAFAYSSLVSLPGNMIGLFYEAHGHKDIRVARFSLEWLLGDKQ